MPEIEFNLTEEKWVRVLMPDCSVQEVSLTEALLRAHEFRDLAGELPTQDAAVLRLLLAVLQAVFYRVDETGAPAALTNSRHSNAGSSFGHSAASPKPPFKNIWTTGKSASGCSTPNGPFIRCSRPRLERSTALPS